MILVEFYRDHEGRLIDKLSFVAQAFAEESCGHKWNDETTKHQPKHIISYFDPLGFFK